MPIEWTQESPKERARRLADERQRKARQRQRQADKWAAMCAARQRPATAA